MKNIILQKQFSDGFIPQEQLYCFFCSVRAIFPKKKPIQFPLYFPRDVKQVFPSRSVPYRRGLVVDRVTAGLSRADCVLQNAGPNPYRRIYKPSRGVPRDASLSKLIKPPTTVSFMNVQVEELCKRVEESSLSFTKALSKSMSQNSVYACVLKLKAFFLLSA